MFHIDDPTVLTGIARRHRRAAEITALAHRRVMSMLRPGLSEGALKAAIDDVFAEHGASGAAFPHIVGSGPNSTIIHYEGSRRILQPGDVVVVDIGAKYRGWAADITRTYPVSGHFTRRQRDIYQLVLGAQSAAAAHIVPGRTSIAELTAFVAAYFRQSSLRARDSRGRLRAMDIFFTHSAGHYLARQVHPPADYARPIPLGQVFTIEPGLYIPGEGLGVRIEDDYFLTDDGAWNLWPDLPSDPDTTEALIRGPRARE